uniref:Uncharacterized protein n=1 Tax=Anguilla anguilla TaxID=7936 RepID=A0A0E9QR23_ANGAN
MISVTAVFYAAVIPTELVPVPIVTNSQISNKCTCSLCSCDFDVYFKHVNCMITNSEIVDYRAK